VFHKVRHSVRQYWQLVTAIVAALISLGFQLFGPHVIGNWILGVTSLLLVIPLLVDMWEDVRTGTYGIDILAATAVVGSVVLHQYWTAIVIVIMVASGEGLEAFAQRRAHGELKALLARAPQQAHLIRGRKNLDVAASEVQAGDKIIIKSGEVVPVDAIILEGKASFDEASLTGESLPVTKQVGEQILSGTINMDGVITAKAVHTAADSQYEQIVSLVKGAANNKAPFVRLADRYSIPFTITAYIIAAAAWVTGHHAIRFLEVIVVATPCPLLLAAPIALISGMSRASKYGIIIKTGSALERLAEAETFAFDKTGTLTEGEPQVDTVTAFKPYNKNEVLGLAASLEYGSVHVLAQAIIKATDTKHVNFTKAKHLQEISGSGMKAILHGKEVLVGRLGLLAEHAVDLAQHSVPKQTATYVAVDGKLAGIITFKDEPRAESKRTLEQLKKFGVKNLLMVTGDNKEAAQVVAKKLGIGKVYAEASPGDKLYTIEKLKDRPVAFVGDGVNDAPVLTASDIGIALGARGSTAASESADVVIMRDDISYVAQAVGIARRSFSIAKQSIIIGIMLSLILMLVFATGKFSPLLGAVLQEFVDVFVIFNALRAHLNPKAEA
jgi:heavy metal translocating P-type ATPase